MTTSPVEFALAFSTGLVAFVFALSGLTKLGRSAETLAAMTALRVPLPLRRPLVARLVPVAEIALALVLVTLPGVPLAAAGAASLILLALFTVLLVGVIRRGDDVDCGCFGALSMDDRVSAWSIARNALLLAASAVVAVFGFGSDGFVPTLLTSDVTMVLALALAWALLAVVALLRGTRTSSMHRTTTNVLPAQPRTRAPSPLSPASIALGIDPSRPGEVFAGDAIPVAEVVSENGVTQTLRELASRGPAILFFLSVGCGTCAPVAEAIPAWAKALAPVPLYVITSSTPSQLETRYPEVKRHARYGALAALAAIGVQRSPAAVVLGGAEGVVASPIAYGIGEIEGLIASVAAARGVRIT